jgi:hypothetical protein
MVLLGAVGCPIGCPRGKSDSSPYKPSVAIPIQQINPCQYRVVGEVPHRDDGWSYVGCFIDEEAAIPHVHWDLDGGIVTILKKNYCSTDAGAHSLELFFREWIPPRDDE